MYGMGVSAARIDMVRAILPDLKISQSILADIQIRVYRSRIVNPTRPREHRKATEDRTHKFTITS